MRVSLLFPLTSAKAFFAISAPHHGALLANFYPGKGSRDM
jgi:hypothetical protein